MEIATLLADRLGADAHHLLMVFLRVGAAVSLFPAFGERSLPARIKLTIALVFTLIVAPATPGPGVLSFPQILSIGGAEILTGLVFGIALRLLVLALQTAGSIAAQATSLSQILGGMAAEPMPAMGHVLVLSGITLAVVLGLHVLVAEYLIQSYALLPTGSVIAAQDIASWGTGQVARMFSLALSLAAPFVIASLVYNLALGAINRAMPQLMVAFVGAPFITFGGLFLLFAGAPLLLTLWHDALLQTLSNPLETLP
ncbi:flagellar biosynthetic protein FliR [Ruegeria hyattellae]|uniref:flagellar biosynthetic protein FliR n=1 Tax=Ruegeria hyattellae TaxID=3233337 RepID=UPI00355AFDDA